MKSPKSTAERGDGGEGHVTSSSIADLPQIQQGKRVEVEETMLAEGEHLDIEDWRMQEGVDRRRRTKAEEDHQTTRDQADGDNKRELYTGVGGEHRYMRDYECCDLHLATMADLLRHYETAHEIWSGTLQQPTPSQFPSLPRHYFPLPGESSWDCLRRLDLMQTETMQYDTSTMAPELRQDYERSQLQLARKRQERAEVEERIASVTAEAEKYRLDLNHYRKEYGSGGEVSPPMPAESDHEMMEVDTAMQEDTSSTGAGGAVGSGTISGQEAESKQEAGAGRTFFLAMRTRPSTS